MDPTEEGRLASASPKTWARWAGIFELLEGLASGQGQVFILRRFLVAGDPAETATRILASPSLYLLGFALSVAAVVFHLAWLLYFHRIFEPVNRTVCRLATWIMIVGCALQAVTAGLYLAPLAVLQHSGPLAAFSEPQLHSLAYLLLRLNGQFFNLTLVVFGVWCVFAGYLMFRSGFFPRILGVLWMLDGLGWTLYVWPPLGAALFPVIATLSGLAEFPTPWWLIFAGVNEQRWREQARR